MLSGSTTFDTVLASYVTDTGSLITSLLNNDVGTNYQGTYNILARIFAFLGSLIVDLTVFVIVIAVFIFCIYIIFIPLAFLFNGLIRRVSNWSFRTL